MGAREQRAEAGPERSEWSARGPVSYPPVVYRGDTGELSATHRPSDTAPDLTASNGNTYEYLATGAGTNTLFGLYRITMLPQTGGPAPHFHRTITESFFVLAGTVKIFDGRDWLDCRPGDWVHVPEGGVHGFGNRSDDVAQMLLHFAPGGPREAYFEGLVHVADMTPDERAAFYLEHDNHWL